MQPDYFRRPRLWPKFAEQGYPKAFAPILLVGLLGLFLSGALLIPVLLTYRWELDLPWVPRGGWRQGITAVHHIAGYWVVGLAGALWIVHARAGLLRRQRHHSGRALLGLILMLLFSVPLLLYLSDETLLTWAATAHTLAGLGLLMMFLAHAWPRHR
ncbi:hypothetical protein [Halothiobacillus sp. DCM-1]|uniref:hypothetical protein n=1 Tax=Halothiobacillus sp. DCM-1 TaxID=3112558 RepID=UPI00325004AF